MLLQQPEFYGLAQRQVIRLLEHADQPVHAVDVNSIIESCVRCGFMPHSLMDFAESRGVWMMPNMRRHQTSHVASGAHVAPEHVLNSMDSMDVADYDDIWAAGQTTPTP